MGQTAKHIIFVGRVQGVGFRFTAFNIANRYELAGFVRNVYNGTVEMFVQGPAETVDNCVRDIGEEFGKFVTETKIEEAPLDPKYEDFKITF
ncbi:MAG: acylphosphatase [Sedimentisphaerales bacterium]|nr:acylphosphatase [Sedimentisphaerales bacterium]